MSERTKSVIKWIRRIQLGARILQCVGALGVLALMILISNVPALTAWVMRITGGVVAVHSVYSAFHHARPARARTPASSAAYQLFSCVFDMATMALYAFGAMSARNQSQDWETLLTLSNAKAMLNDYFIPALYYTLISAGGLHLLTLSNGLYLLSVFFRITKMPPDMNPLEDHLTARMSSRHKRNKSSIATYSTVFASEASDTNRLSTPLERKHRSGAPYEEVNCPPSVPFTHSRVNSAASGRDSRLNLPSRQYQVQASNSPRSSFADVYVQCHSVPSGRGSIVSQNDNYTTYPASSRASTKSVSSLSVIEPASYGTGDQGSSTGSNTGSNTPRQAKFTEAWYTSDSLLDRTAKRAARQCDSKTYSAIAQHNEDEDGNGENGNGNYNSDYSNSADEAGLPHGKVSSRGGLGGKGLSYRHVDRQGTIYRSGYLGDDVDLSTGESLRGYHTPRTKTKSPLLHPLRQHPPTASALEQALSEIDLNSRRVSGPNSGDIAETRPLSELTPPPKSPFRLLSSNVNSYSNSDSESSNTKLKRPYSVAEPITGPGAVTGRLSPYTTNDGLKSPPPSKNNTSIPVRTPTKFSPRQRESSIQPEEGLFVTKPYGDSRAATPPIMVGSTRQVSSGNDYGSGDLGGDGWGGRISIGSVFGRRHVSGKVAEEGRSRWSRYSALRDD